MLNWILVRSSPRWTRKGLKTRRTFLFYFTWLKTYWWSFVGRQLELANAAYDSRMRGPPGYQKFSWAILNSYPLLCRIAWLTHCFRFRLKTGLSVFRNECYRLTPSYLDIVSDYSWLRSNQSSSSGNHVNFSKEFQISWEPLWFGLENPLFNLVRFLHAITPNVYQLIFATIFCVLSLFFRAELQHQSLQVWVLDPVISVF